MNKAFIIYYSSFFAWSKAFFHFFNHLQKHPDFDKQLGTSWQGDDIGKLWWMDWKAKRNFPRWDCSVTTLWSWKIPQWGASWTLHNFSEPNSLLLLHHRVSSFFFSPQSASGTGLAFIAFTEAVKEMPAPQVWAILFFVMLFTLGLSSMFGNMEGILTPLKDLHVLPKWMPNEVASGKSNLNYGLLFWNVPLTENVFFLLFNFSGLLCVVSFLVALIFTQSSGNYWVEVFNGYVGSVPLLLIAFFEIVGVAYIYGIRK